MKQTLNRRFDRSTYSSRSVEHAQIILAERRQAPTYPKSQHSLVRPHTLPKSGGGIAGDIGDGVEIGIVGFIMWSRIRDAEKIKKVRDLLWSSFDGSPYDPGTLLRIKFHIDDNDEVHVDSIFDTREDTIGPPVHDLRAYNEPVWVKADKREVKGKDLQELARDIEYKLNKIRMIERFRKDVKYLPEHIRRIQGLKERPTWDKVKYIANIS